jgi:hypothetical protein
LETSLCIHIVLNKQIKSFFSSFFFSYFCFWCDKMSNSIQTDKSLVKFLTLLVVIYSFQLCESHLAELLFEEEDSPSAAAANINHLPQKHAVIEDNNETPCHVEFMVMKRAVGHCVKLGKRTTACVSGSYIHPFHQDCM